MEPFRCRACDAPLARSASTCGGCGLVLDWTKYSWRLRYRKLPWRGPDAEVRSYARASVSQLVWFSALCAFSAAISACAIVWIPDHYTPELREAIEATLVEERAEDEYGELILQVFDLGRAGQHLAVTLLSTMAAMSTLMAAYFALMVPVARRLAAEPADPAAATSGESGSGAC